MPDHFARLTHHSDSVFVRDFYVPSCYSGDPNIYTSHHLINDEEWIKEKFNVDYVHFDAREHIDWNNPSEKEYNLIYNTWSARLDWITLFDCYGPRQTETLLADNKNFYKREATYHWLFFFWFPTFEFWESTTIN